MATRGTFSIPEHTLACPLRLNEAYVLILFYLYHILSLLFLASVMIANKLEGVKSPMGKFLFSLPPPDLLWAYSTSYPPSNGTPFKEGKLAWHETEYFSFRFCRRKSIEINPICHTYLSIISLIRSLHISRALCSCSS